MAENQENTPLIDPGVVGKSESEQLAEQMAAKNFRPKGPDRGGFYWGTGRRKRSVARVRVRPGDGKLIINKKELKDYFPKIQDQEAVKAPLDAVDAGKGLDVFVNVKGGGSTGQSGATKLGIARALCSYDVTLMKTLRDHGYLTRDGRMVERKKYGKAGARRSYQFSKR